MARSTWLCPQCSNRNDRAGGRRKCVTPGCTGTAPKRRVPVHARVLRDTSYQDFALLSVLIHGGDKDCCGVCGRPMGENRRHNRDHDHRTGQARGLACVRCNRELLRNSTLEEARAVVAYLERVEVYYSAQEVEA